MELRHLRYFVVVAEELHFGRAARLLHMSQQPLSRQIRNLEAELEVQLFHRTKRTVRLTAAGEAFLREAQKVLAQAKHAVATAKRVDRGEVGLFQVAFSGIVLNGILPAVVRQFKQQFPHIHLELKRVQTNEQVKALIDGEIHAGLLHPPVDKSLLSYEVIHREPLYIAIPGTHPLAQDAPSPVSIRAIAGEPLVMIPRKRGPVLYDSIVAFCQQNGYSPNIVQEAFPQLTILGLVAAGVGLAIIHASAWQIGQRGIVMRPIVEETPVVESAIAWRTDTVHPALPHFLSVARELSQVNFHMRPFDAQGSHPIEHRLPTARPQE